MQRANAFVALNEQGSCETRNEVSGFQLRCDAQVFLAHFGTKARLAY